MFSTRRQNRASILIACMYRVSPHKAGSLTRGFPLDGSLKVKRTWEQGEEIVLL